MDSNSYYQNLLQQGYSATDAASFTKQYYPDFQAPVQGMEMMAPPPSPADLGVVASAGAAAPTSVSGAAMASGGIAAAGAGAAAGSGMSVATIAVVSVLVLGGAGTAGYFIYDYLTEPDFYGEIYWSEFGFGYIFEEDEMKIVISAQDSDCEYQNELLGITSWTYSDGLCTAPVPYDDYESTDEGDYYKICITIEDDEKSCSEVYPFEKGIALINDDTCSMMISDISVPNFSSATEDDYDDMMEWKNKFEDIADEIREDAPSVCDNSIDDDYEENIVTYQFSFGDAPGDMSNSSGDNLIYLQMEQGDDISWSLVKIDMVVDGGSPLACADEEVDDGSAACVFQNDGDNTWSTGERIYLFEGSMDLCDGSNGYCEIDVTIVKLGVGNEDDRVLGYVSTYADGTN